MGRHRFLAFTALTASVWLAAAGTTDGSTAPRPPIFADLADSARALPPEFAADVLLRIVDAPKVADAAWKREVLEDAFQLAGSAQQPFARRNWTGWPVSPLDKAYTQGLDASTLQCKAVHGMLAIDYKRAREMFGEMPPPQIPRLTCEGSLVYDVSIFYATAGEVAARAFNMKETADEKPFHFLQRYAAEVTSAAQVTPIARMLAGASVKPPQLEALVNSFAGGLQLLSGDDRSFSAIVLGDADGAIADLQAACTSKRVSAQPLLEAWRAYTARQFGGARCADAAARVPGGDVKPASVDGKARPAAPCDSPQCRQLAAQSASLVMAPNGYGFTPEQRATAEWAAKLRQYLAALGDWKDDDNPVDYFQNKSRFYGDLFYVAPDGPDRDLLLSTMLAWLQENGYRREHPAEWFYPVNMLLIHAFADPAGMKTAIRELRRSPDPVITLYAQLEQLLPRPLESTIGLW
ncbi:MAG TPA: hypothetical protein VN924_29575 [Bryobacteraceae bacterium]|nr:hypothetical protein [Bryobacteraceae bacterium]